MTKLLTHLKNWWVWVLGLVGGLVVWLKFVHDPRVASQARRKVKVKELDKRRENLESTEAETRRSEERLNKKRRKLKEKLDDRFEDEDVDSVADRMAERFGWGGGTGEDSEG